MVLESFIPDALAPHDTVGYFVSRRLRELFPERRLLQAREGGFALEEYARAGHCALALREIPHAEIVTSWGGPFVGLRRSAVNAWYIVTWQGRELEVLFLQWNGNDNYFVLADTLELAERFYLAVCEWQMGAHAEVLVFDGHRWRKDEELFKDIQGVTFDTLVLEGGLKEEIRADLLGFFAARASYEQYGVPWKRGILFLGPPGNGKTHAVKAVINALGQPCLYVRALPFEGAICAAFDQARRSAPCILVLEDLDALVKKEHRSALLNELDGFSANRGIVTLATTNHPERLDPALIDRPSRFDRKYHFNLPTVEVRRVYIEQWNGSLQPALRLSPAAVAQLALQTEGFSFAYLKELFLSATMRWIAAPVPGSMERVMREQLALLRSQMPTSTATRIKSTLKGMARAG